MYLFPIRHFESQKGQVLLVVVLTMVVALTVGLSLASRTVTSVRNGAEDTNSKKAFSAAEAGIEQSLKSGLEISNQQIDNETSIKEVTIDNNYGRSIFLLNDGNPLPKNDGADVWLSTYPDYSDPRLTGTLQIYWGDNASACLNAALEVAIISGTRTSPMLERYALDPCTTRGNSFDSPSGNGGTILGHTFHESIAISVTNGLIARIVPYYFGTPVAVVAKDAQGNTLQLPSQGRLITSVGVSKDTQRKISYFQGYNEIPSELYNGIFQTQ